jgi:hypothetical protein
MRFPFMDSPKVMPAFSNTAASFTPSNVTASEECSVTVTLA